MAYEYLQVFVVVILLTCSPQATSGLSSDDKKSIKFGIDAGKAIADVLKDGNFRDTIKSIGKNLGPYLGVLGPIAGLVTAFIPGGESAELKFMRQEFKKVNIKLDIITSEFKEIKNAIAWNTVVVSYGVYERKIRATEDDLNKFYNSRPNHAKGPKNEFLQSYKIDFDNSLQKLYDVLMYNDHVFSKNILEAVIRQTKNNNRKFEKFSLEVIQLLIQGIKVKVAAYSMQKGYTKQNVLDLQLEWTKKMDALGKRMEEKGNEIKRIYMTQLKEDYEDLILRNYKLDNKGLMETIYSFVEEKYNWRSWFVAVYDGISGYDKHAVSYCGGYVFFRQHRKNIIIASQDKYYTSWFSQTKANQVLVDVYNDINNCKLARPGGRAKALRDQIRTKTGRSCVPYALVLVVVSGKHLHYRSLEKQSVYRNFKLRKCCRSRSRRSPWWGSPWWGNTCSTTNWNDEVTVFG